MLLLRDRSADLGAAGVRPFAISRDSVWSHAAWAQALGVDVPLLSDWNGDTVRGFGVAAERSGMKDVAERTAFLIEDGVSVGHVWALGPELPDVDAVIAAALSRRW